MSEFFAISCVPPNIRLAKMLMKSTLGERKANVTHKEWRHKSTLAVAKYFFPIYGREILN